MITRTRGSLSLLAIAAAIAVAPKASAQEQAGYASNHIDLSERGSRWFVLDSVDIQGNGRLALGVVNDFSYRSVVRYDDEGNAANSIVRNQYVLNLGGSVVVADRVRIGVGVPLQLFADGHTTVINGTVHRPSEDIAVGDVRLSVDGRLLGAPGDVASLAVGAALFAPSGTPSAYTGDGKPRVEPRVAFAGRATSFAYAAKLGVMFRARDEAWGDGRIGHSLTGGLAAGMLLADGKLLVGPELFGSTGLSGGERVTPLEALLGAHLDVSKELRFGLSAGAGLTRDYGAPVARGLLSFEWVPGDAKPEPPPPVVDRDGDGITDCEDACSFVKGVASADPAKNGCPLDTDSDGVPDTIDACPTVPGIASADGAANGCPQDSDRDGVADAEDACPRDPGKRTADPKTSGCPEVKAPPPPPNPDRDGDGVPNDVDACPDEPGKSDPVPRKNGCPKAFLQGGTIKITEQVKFKTASAEIVAGKESSDILDAVVAVLKAHPEIKALRVEGHTDDRGDAAMNKTLSQARAESVAKWLETHGIEKSRLAAAGFGAEKPIESNATEQGRTNNRRVEFHVEQGSGR